MDIVRTGIGIGKTIRNVSRLKEILSVFAKNGFDELILKIKIAGVLPDFVIPKTNSASINLEERGEDLWGAIGYRLRESFEELGPSFIKLGQVLATREDIFDQSFIAQMKKLHGDTKPMPFETVKTIIENNLGGNVEKHFQHIEQTPIGTASIGGVYKAELIDGTDVVIKVRKPNLQKMITGDFEILDWIVFQLEKVSTDVKSLGLRSMLAQFEKGLHRELNFYQEARNAQKLQAGLDKMPEASFIIIPKVYDDFTSEDILVMDYLEGVPFTSITSIDDLGENGLDKLKTCVRSFVYSMLREGFFHADLHGGNFFLLNDGNIGLIDFGLMGSLSQKNRVSLVVILSSMLNEDFDRLVSEFLDIADYQRMPDEKVLVRDIRDALAPYLGLSVQQTDIQALFRGLFEVLTRHRIMLPTEWFLIFRSMVMLDGIGQSLKVDLNFHELVFDDIDSMAGNVLNMDQLKTEAIWLGRDVLSSARVLPRHVRRFAQHFEKRDYALELEIQGVKKGFGRIANSIEFLALMIMTGVFASLSVVLLKDKVINGPSDISFGAWFLLLMSLVSFLWGFKRLPRK